MDKGNSSSKLTDVKITDKHDQCITSAREEMANAFSSRGDSWMEAKEFVKAEKDYTQAVGIVARVDDFFKRGVCRLSLDQVSDASTDFNEVIEKVPDHKALLYRGYTRHLMGKSNEAIKDLDKAIDLYNEEKLAYLYRSKVWLDKGELDKSKTDLDKAFELGLVDDMGYQVRGQIYQKKNDHESAIEEFRKAIHINENNFDCQLGFIHSLMQMERYNQTIFQCKRLQELGVKENKLNLILGRTRFHLGEYDKALTHFSRALKDKPTIEAYLGQGDTYFYLREINKAEEIYLKALDQEQSCDIYVRLTKLYLASKKYEVAKRNCLQGLKINPEDKVLKLLKALIFCELGRFNEALEDFEVILKREIKVTYGIAYLYQAKAYWGVKNYEQCIHDATLIIERYLYHLSKQERVVDCIDPLIIDAGFIADAYFMRARAKKEVNNFEQSLNDINQAIKEKAKYEFYTFRGDLYRSSNKLDLAIADYGEGLGMQPSLSDKNEILLKRGDCYLEISELLDAAKDMTMIIQEDGNNKIAFQKRAVAKYLWGNYNGAIEDINKSLSSEATAFDYFMRGKSQNKCHEYYSAVQDFSKALLSYPGELKLDLLIKRGVCWKKLRKTENAQKDFKQALEILSCLPQNTISVADLEKHALIYIHLNEFDRAYDEYSKAIRKKSISSLYIDRASVSKRQGEINNQLADINKAIKIDSSDEALNIRGDLYFSRGRDYDAIADFSKVITKHSISKKSKIDLLGSSIDQIISAYYRRAKVYEKIDKHFLAKEDYQVITTIAENLIDTELGSPNQLTYWTGISYLKLNKPKEAVSVLTVTINSEPNNIDALYYRAEAQVLLKQFDAAIQDYTSVIAIKNDFYRAYFNRAKIYFTIDQFEQTVQDTSFIIEKINNAEVYHLRALAHEKLGWYQKAIDDCSKEIKIDPTASAYMFRGQVKFKEGLYKEAAEDLVEAGRIKPTDEIFGWLGDSLFCQEKFDEATLAYNKGIELKDTAELRTKRGELWLKRGDYHKSTEDFSKAIDLMPSSRAYFGLGLTWKKILDFDQAERDFSKALEYESKAVFYIERAFVRNQMNDVDSALSDINKSFDMDLGVDILEEGYRVRGLIYLRKKDYEKAYQDFSFLIERRPTVEAYINRAECLCRWRKLDTGLKDYAKAIELDPNNVAIYFSRGNMWLSRGDRKALEDFSRCTTIEAKNVIAWNKKGLAWLKLENTNRAINDFKYAIRLDKDYYPSYLNRGRAYLQSKEYQKAIEDLTKALTYNAEDNNVLYYRGVGWLQLGEYSNAVSDFSKIIDKQSDHLNARRKRGETYFKLNDLNRAINDFTIVLEEEKHFNDYYLRGRTLFLKGEYGSAVDDFTRSIEIRPLSDSLFWRGKSWHALKDYKQAIGDYDIAIKMNSKIVYLVARGLAYHKIGDITQAEQDLMKALSRDNNNNEEILVHLADLYNDQGLYNKAITLSSWAIKSKNTYKAYNSKANAYNHLGEYRKALNNANKSLALNPSNLGALDVRGYSYFHLGRYEKARKDYDTILEHDPNNLSVLLNRAKVLYRCEEYDGAIKDLDSFIVGESSNLEVWNLRGNCFLAKGKYKEAIGDYSHYLSKKESDQGRFNRGYTWYRMGNYHKAIIDYTESIEIKKAAKTYKERGICLYKLGKYKAALEDFYNACIMEADLRSIHFYLGCSAYSLEKWQQAVDEFSISIEKEPFAIAYLYRGYAYMQLEELDSALEDFSRSLTLENTVVALHSRGYANHRVARYEEAIADYSAVIKSGKATAMTYLNKGCALAKLEIFNQAVVDFEKVIEMLPECVHPYVNRALINQKLSKYERSYKDLEKAEKLDSQNAMVMLYKGNAYVEFKKYDQALEAYNQATQIDSSIEDVYRRRGVLYGIMGETQKALDDFEYFKELETSNQNSSSLLLKEKEWSIADFHKVDVCILERTPSDMPELQSISVEDILYTSLHAEDFEQRNPKNKETTGSTESSNQNKKEAGGKLIELPVIPEMPNIDVYEKEVKELAATILANPDSKMAYFSRAQAHEGMNEYLKAIDDYSRAIELEPGYLLALAGRGLVWTVLQEDEKAISDFSKIIALDSGCTSAYFLRGNAFKRMKSKQDSLSDYLKAIELVNKKPLDTIFGLRNYLGNLRFDSIKYLKEIEEVSEKIKGDSSYAQLFHDRGRAYYMIRQYDKAVIDFEQTRKQDSSFVSVLAQIMKIDL